MMVVDANLFPLNPLISLVCTDPKDIMFTSFARTHQMNRLFVMLWILNSETKPAIKWTLSLDETQISKKSDPQDPRTNGPLNLSI